ncbi:DNA adenine methylase [Micromonospora sp. NPDC005173]|uniref:DNA adenine methylase n=1 Tax=Micromonospora sp. NPDC005173 TaxID=3157165 RepID=UPI0033BD0EBC
MEGDWQSLASFMEEFPHVGNSSDAAKAAAAAGACTTSDKYCLATLYFAGGYFSLRQAIHLDALRYAIESADLGNADRNWLLAAWISSAAVVINAPGHTAQYLKVSGEISQARVRRAWRRNVWDVFLDRLTQVSQEGTAAWRSGNKVFNDEALSLAASDKVDGVGAIYADPPYTKDHYSRYYHVYETLFRYDFPDSAGAGRYRSDRFVTEFSIKTKVSGAFEALAAAAKKRDAPLVLSYPDNGLLVGAGVELGELLRSHFNHVAVMSFGHDHSTLGASQGEQKKRAVENIYVCS